MNATIRRTSAVMALLILALIVNVNVLAVIQDDDLRARDGNRRQIIDEYDHKRGSIVVGPRAIAESVKTEGRLNYLREYTDGELYAPLTGYYSQYGATGIEKYESDLLTGTDDRLFVDRLKNLFTGQQPRGGNVVLSIDPDAQRAAYDGLDGQAGAVAAIDPQTGAILALVSSPSFDPNVLASHDAEEVTANFQQLEKAADDPLLNRASQQLYPPGSLFKVVVAAAALASGDYKPSTMVDGPQTLDLPDTNSVISNYDDSACLGGELTLQQALAISCNTAFAGIGLDLGDDVLRKQADAFGFDTQLQTPLPVVPSVYPQQLNEPQTAQSAIGQFDVRSTVLQMAMVGGAVANNGLVMKPYVVAEEQAPDLSSLSVTEPEQLSRAVSPTVAGQLSDMMVSVVNEGTGTSAQISGTTVGGKTGTAQDGTQRPPHVWFMSFAPAEDPQVAVAVIVENGGRLGDDATGGGVAGPIARSVMEAVLQ